MVTQPFAARKDRLLLETHHDPYKAKRKPAEPCYCPDCGAVFRAGRWQWLKVRPMGARSEICQACRRARDNFPAGVLVIRGVLPGARRDEMLNLLRNEAEAERAQHPQHRILSIQQRSDEISVNTADIHLPRRLGEALRRAYKGQLEVTCDRESGLVRVAETGNP